MNTNRYTLLWTALIFSSLLLAGNKTMTFSMAESIANPSIFDLAKEVQPESKQIPPEVQSAVLEAASQQTSRTVASLVILNSQPKEWSDGCLGLTEPGQVCIQTVISGWQVEVTDGLRNWTFRTDGTGDLVKLEES